MRLILSVFAAGFFLALCGCSGGDRKPSGPIPGVAPLSEPDFDRFSSRIAERVAQVVRLRGDVASVDIAAPSISGASVEPVEIARPFSTNLSDALNDRLIGVATVTPHDAGMSAAPDASSSAGLASDVPPLRSTLSFTPIAAATGGEAERRVVTFALVDARDGAELMRESHFYDVPVARASSTRRQSKPPRSPERPAPVLAAPSRAAETAPPPSAGTIADAMPAPEATVIPPAEPSRSAARAERPRAAASVERPARPATPTPAAEERESNASAAAERVARPARAPASVKKQRVKIDRDERGLGAFLSEQLPAHREHAIPGGDGTVLFVDEGAWRRFRLLAQRSLRTPDGKLRIELDIRSRDRRRNAKLRVVFLDENGAQTEVSPIIPERFMGDYTRTVLFTSAGTRSARYIVLFAND